MKIYSKFDESLLGEAEGSENDPISDKESIINPLKIGRLISEGLRDIRKNRDMMNVYSHETGKTIISCKQEIDTTLLFLEISGLRKIYEKYGERSVSSRSFIKDTATFLDEGIPIFSMTNQILRNLMEGRANVICHSENAPLTTMYLVQQITDIYDASNSIFYHLIGERGVNEKLNINVDKAYIWGSDYKIRELERLMNRRVNERKTSNYPVIVRNYSSISSALDRIMNMSLNSISNNGLRGQIYLVQDKDFVFFRNRVTELLKRTADEYYGPESSVNYFSSKSHAENTRKRVASLLGTGWDYLEDLPETVHVLADQYGDIPEKIEMLDGPVIEIMHYSSLMDCAKRIERMDFGDRINIFGDSMNDLEFLREFFGARKMVINGKSTNEMMTDFIA
ncbi:hypothetical protein ACNF40_04240 [Cuniculiplasma sp. SKW4]|uniref:hypothetical protein n=1 Tax=Cuniculiplasma sp. SKW4 TaxID=3400171 RepID=UPI003FD3AE1B